MEVAGFSALPSIIHQGPTKKKRNENRYNAFFKIFKFDENFKKEEAMGVDKVL